MAGVYGLYVELSQRCVIASVCVEYSVCVWGAGPRRVIQ